VYNVGVHKLARNFEIHFVANQLFSLITFFFVFLFVSVFLKEVFIF